MQKNGEDVYLTELLNDAKKFSNLKIIPFYTEKDGFLTAEYIQKHSGNFTQDTAFLICGPPGMMKSLRLQLRGKGVLNKSIHTEEFSLS